MRGREIKRVSNTMQIRGREGESERGSERRKEKICLWRLRSRDQ